MPLGIFLAFYMPANLNLADFDMPFFIFKAIRMPSIATIHSVTQCQAPPQYILQHNAKLFSAETHPLTCCHTRSLRSGASTLEAINSLDHTFLLFFVHARVNRKRDNLISVALSNRKATLWKIKVSISL